MNHIYFEQKCLYLHPKVKIPPSVTLGLLSLPRPMSQTSVTIGSVKVLCAYFWHIFGLSGTYAFGYLRYVGHKFIKYLVSWAIFGIFGAYIGHIWRISLADIFWHKLGIPLAYARHICNISGLVRPVGIELLGKGFCSDFLYLKVCLKIGKTFFSSNKYKCCKKSLESYCMKLISHQF